MKILFDPQNKEDVERVLEIIGKTDSKPTTKKVHVKGKVLTIGKTFEAIKIKNKWYDVADKSKYETGQFVDEELPEHVFSGEAS